MRSSRSAPSSGRRCSGSVRTEVLELEHVDVEVAARARDALEPAELRAEVLKRLGWEGGAQLPQQRARPPHGHPEFVQELTVDVSDRPGQVRLDQLEQRLQDPARCTIRPLVGFEAHARLRRHAGGAAARPCGSFVLQRNVGGYQPNRRLEQSADLRQLLVVAENADRVQARPERTLAIAHDARLLQHQPNHRLALIVEHAQRQRAALHEHQARKRPPLHQRQKQLPQTAGRQIGGEQMLRRSGLVGAGALVVAALEQRQASPLVHQRQPGSMQTAVEGVIEAPLPGRKRVSPQRECGRQRPA